MSARAYVTIGVLVCGLSLANLASGGEYDRNPAGTLIGSALAGAAWPAVVAIATVAALTRKSAPSCDRLTRAGVEARKQIERYGG